ncbi:hypothetical protein DFH28DRAFT_978987 [Melampsora americana]|nr:hypothetical protein DFH28DRAFT_978987 [Melampsora americana]
MKLYSLFFTIHSCFAMMEFGKSIKDEIRPKSPNTMHHDPRIWESNFASHRLSSSVQPSTTESPQMQSTTDPRIFEINIIPVHSTTDPLQPTVNGKPVKLYGVLPHELHSTHDPSETSSPESIRRYLNSLVKSGHLQSYQPVPEDTTYSGHPHGPAQPIGEMKNPDVQVYLPRAARLQTQYHSRGQGALNEAPFDPFEPTDRKRYLKKLDELRKPRNDDSMKINLDILCLINPKLRLENLDQESDFSSVSFRRKKTNYEDSDEDKLDPQGKDLNEISKEDGTTETSPTKKKRKQSKVKKFGLGEWIYGKDEKDPQNQGGKSILSEILLKTLKEHHKNLKLRIHLSQTDLFRIRKTGLIKSWSDWEPFIDKFLQRFSDAEGQRRVSALMAQFDQFMISELTAENLERFSANVLKFSEIIRLKEPWPVFYDLRITQGWERFISEFEDLTRYDEKDSKLIQKIISAENYHSRLKTMKVMSDANLENYEKLFEIGQMKKFAKQGLSVAVIQRIDTIFQLSREEMIKENSSYILNHVQKLQDFYDILRGRFVERPIVFSDTKSWLLSPEANLFASIPHIKNRFLNRLKQFLEEVGEYRVAYKIWEEGDQSPEFKLNPSPQDWEYQKIDGAEAVTCALFGLPLKQFAMMKNEMLHKREINDDHQFPNTLQWPVNISEEIQPHLESFKRVYDFLGVQILGLNSQFDPTLKVKTYIN